MTTIAKTELKEKRPLQPVAVGGWRGGFTNLLRKELSQWWGTKMWWIQLIIWVLILNGITTIIMVTEGQEKAPVELLQEVVQTFLELGAFAISFGVIATAQGVIVAEKQLGTAAWVMSKPASRPAFILAKVVAYVLGFAVVAILVPATIFIVEAGLLISVPMTLPPFLAGLAVMSLSPLFYLMLTLMLGTVFESRGPIIGIGIAVIMSGMLLNGLFPPEVTAVTPWLLGQISGMVSLEMPLPDYWLVPLVAAGVWVLIFMGVALQRFSREEF